MWCRQEFCLRIDRKQLWRETEVVLLRAIHQWSAGKGDSTDVVDNLSVRLDPLRFHLEINF